MTRSSRWTVVVAAALWIALAGPWAAAGPVEIKVEPAGGQAGGQPYRGWTNLGMSALPGFWYLGQPHVQKELKLSDEQKQKLKDIGSKYAEESRQDWTGWQGVPAEERQKKMAEVQQKIKARTEEARKRVEAVLTPDQLQASKMINLRLRAGSMLASPWLYEKLGVTEEQQKKLQQNQEQYQQKMQELQNDSGRKALEVLTPEQVEKFQKMDTQGYATPGAAVETKK